MPAPHSSQGNAAAISSRTDSQRLCLVSYQTLSSSFFTSFSPFFSPFFSILLHSPPFSSLLLLLLRQLQSLVAKTQWGQLTPLLQSLLEDRQNNITPSTSYSTTNTPHRSIYRETLFFKAAILGSINVGKVIMTSSLLRNNDVIFLYIDQFDQEFQQAILRLPRSLSSILTSEDFPPSQRARHCRTDFGPLHVT